MATQPQPLPASTGYSFAQIRQIVLAGLAGLVVLFAGVAAYAYRNASSLRSEWELFTWATVLAVVSLAGGLLVGLKSVTTASLRRHTALVLFALAAGFLAVPLIRLTRHPVAVALTWAALWAAVVGIVSVVMALLLFLDSERREAELERFRVYLLALGGVIGFCTALLGFALALSEYRNEILEGLEKWRSNPTAILFPAAALLGGLVLMFLSLQLARGMERSSVGMRRLVYGYNAVFTTLLLIAILALPNVLAYASPFTRFFGRTFDWTRSGFSELSSATRNQMAELKEPITVYILLPLGHPLFSDVQAMLDACGYLTNQLRQVIVDPRQRANQATIDQLQKKYGRLTNPFGLLIVAGNEEKSDHDFIPIQDLGRGEESGGYVFKGENAFVNSVAYLTEGKAVIYFTQGSGEPSLTEARSRGGRTGSLNAVRERLAERKNIQVRDLKFGPTVQEVPADATVVVVVGPTQPFSATASAALGRYAKESSGKLLLMLDPVVRVQGGKPQILPLGLETLLLEFGVQLGQDRVLSLSQLNPILVQAMVNPESSTPISRGFFRSRGGLTIVEPFLLSNTRTVTGLPETRPDTRYKVEPLLVVYEPPSSPDQGIWADRDFNSDVLAVATALRKNRSLADKTLANEPLSVAVTVTESSGAGLPRDVAHAGMFKDKPRMVVFGNSVWLTEEALSSQNTAGLDLFSSCLSWLRDRPAVGQRAPDKTREIYKLGVKETDLLRLQFLPLGLLALTVAGLGIGVWVVRRR